MTRTQTYQPIKKEFIPLEEGQEVEVSVMGLREILQSTEEESDIPTSTGKTENGIVPVPIIVNGTNTHNSGDVAKQGSVRANLLGIIPFAKKLFSKKEKQQLAVAPKPLPEGELVISFYDSAKELLSTETFALTKENQWETLSFKTKTEEKGYVSAKIQGTSSEPVKFDDFSIQLKSLYSAKLYQENHYYPFGMNMKGLESSDKQTQQNKKEHEFQFNAQTEREESFGLFWDETPFRPMDMQLGRFWGVDKLSESYTSFSPFHYAMNNPITGNDPTGLFTSLANEKEKMYTTVGQRMTAQNEIPGDYFSKSGKYLGSDGKDDGKVYVVTDKNEADGLKKGEASAENLKSSTELPSEAVLDEALDVLNRTEDNGGLREEMSYVLKSGEVIKGKTGEGPKVVNGRLIAEAKLPPLPEGITAGDVEATIHSHNTDIFIDNDVAYPMSATEPSLADKRTFALYSDNVIVGRLGRGSVNKNADGTFTKVHKSLGVQFFNQSSKTVNLTKPALKRIIKHLDK